MEIAMKVMRGILSLLLLGLALWLGFLPGDSDSWYVYSLCFEIPVLILLLIGMLIEDALKDQDYHWEMYPRVHMGILIVFAISLGLMYFPMVEMAQENDANRLLNEQLKSNAERVCNSQPAAESRGYDPKQPGIHPIVVVGSSTLYWDEKPEWKPDRVADTQLVACLDSNSVEKGICFYTSGGVKYYSTRFSMSLYSAETGALIAEETWSCSGSCPAILENNEGKLCGGAVLSMPEKIEWLERYVETP